MGSYGTAQYHPRIRAAHRRECRRLGRARAGTLKRFATRTAARRTYLQPYLNQAHAVLAVRLNPASRVATRVRVNVKDANAYEQLCTALGAEEILSGVGAQRRSLDRVPREEWAAQPLLRAVAAGHHAHDVRPAAAPAALHPDRPGQLHRAYVGLAERIAAAVRADVQPLGTVAQLRAYADDGAQLRAAVQRAQPAADPTHVAALAQAVGDALHESRRVLRRVKKLRERETAAADAAARVGSAQGSRGQRASSGDWSDDEEDDEYDSELVAARRELAARRAALEAARTRPLNDAERDELAHEGELVAAVVRAHLTTAPTVTLRARLLAEAERTGAPIACAACGGSSKTTTSKKVQYDDAMAPGPAAGGVFDDGDDGRGFEDVDDGGDNNWGFAAPPAAMEAAGGGYEDLDDLDLDLPPYDARDWGMIVPTEGEYHHGDDGMPGLVYVGCNSCGGRKKMEDTSDDEEEDEADEEDEDGDMMPALEYVGSPLAGAAAASSSPSMPELVYVGTGVDEAAEESDTGMPALEYIAAEAAVPPMPALVHVGAPVRAARPALVPLDEAGSRAAATAEDDNDMPALVANAVAPSPAPAASVVDCASEAELGEHLVEHRAHYDLYCALRGEDVGASLADATTVHLQPVEEFGSYALRKLKRGSTAEKSRAVAALQRASADATAYTPRVRYGGVTFVLYPSAAADEQ